jgi:tetratricopeptide (TPR) repeat protein
MLSVDQIAERLDDCFHLLAGEASTGVPERHRTLRATLEWSYQLLAPAEQAALRRLAVFQGDFDLDAAVAVTEGRDGAPVEGGGPDGFTLIARLVDKSLVEVVRASDDVRYRLLEPIRQYAAGKLSDAGETALARSRHRDAFLARPKSLWPLMTSQERRRAYSDRENLRAALEWSWREGDVSAALRLTAIEAVSWMCPGDAQSREWLERVLAEPDPAVDPSRVRALTSLALSLHDSGQQEERVEQLLRQATALAERLGEAEEIAACSLTSVEIVLPCGRTEEARSLACAALALYERLGALAGVGWCHHSLGWIAAAEDDYVTARTQFERALDVARSDAGGEWLLPHALAALAPLVALLGEPRRAMCLAEEAVAFARPFVGRAVLAMALARAAEAAILADEHRRAEEMLDELLTLLLDLGTRRWAADALEMVGVVLERRGDHAVAASALGASEGLRAASGERRGGIRALAREIQRTTSRLRRTLGPQQFAAHDGRGRVLPPEAAMVEMISTMRSRGSDC